MQIGVIGAGDHDLSSDIIALAEQVGEGIAAEGHLLICGGHSGVMEAACRGAKRAGGTTLGILTGYDKSEGNEYLDIQLTTGIGHARNVIVASSADVLIAIGGSYGTLSEIAFANRLGTPVVGVRTWDAESDAGETLHIERVDDAEQAVKTAIFTKR